MVIFVSGIHDEGSGLLLQPELTAADLLLVVFTVRSLWFLLLVYTGAPHLVPQLLLLLGQNLVLVKRSIIGELCGGTAHKCDNMNNHDGGD